MDIQKLIAVIRRWFGRERAPARCPVAVRRTVQVLFIIVTIAIARFASASVLVTGNVTPADNPFTTGVNEGLPTDGNFVNPFESQTRQTYFEGMHLDNNASDLTDDTNVNIAQIIVGQTSSGSLVISGESALRDETLIIGDKGTLNGVVRPGNGVVRITGFGSLYNNDPTIYPAPLPNIPGGFSSQTPRPIDTGFDLYVGKGGNGSLEISDGASAEIQDAVLVANDTGSTGSIVVDGADSFLGSGNFQTNTVSTTDPHSLIVGRLGVGYMTVTNGATVQSNVVGSLLNNDAIVAGSIGSEPFIQGQAPFTGGVGTVTVNGTASKWILGGSLQVGGFDIGLDGSGIDVEGDNTTYTNIAGRGTLNVQNGALVNINSPAGTADPTQDKLYLAIGRFGTVNLSGGTINVGSGTGGNGGANDQARGDGVIVINDGVIQGTGTIYTGVFRNRYFGQVLVAAGQTLTIDSSSQFLGGVGTTPPDPLINYGLMEVIGTVDSRATLQFVRAPGVPTQPLINRPVFLPPNDHQFIGGVISAQWATLRSASGMQNEGVMSFSAGSNIIQGRLEQFVGPTGFIPQLLIGPSTSVVVEDDCLGCVPTFVGTGNTLQILDPGTFTAAGTITMPLSIASPNLISAAGDIGINGVIKLSYSSDVLADLAAHGPNRSYEILSFTGGAFQTMPGSTGAPVPDYSKPIPDCGASPFCFVPGLGVTGPSLSALLGPSFNNVVPIARRIGGSIEITFLNPASSGAIGPDFNGDGKVDKLDLAIWLANVGITSGATVLQGDADGDGDVDGDDFLFWQRNFGKPMPWSGAGSGSGGDQLSGGAVPEPTGLALAAVAALFSLGARRRR